MKKQLLIFAIFAILLTSANFCLAAPATGIKDAFTETNLGTAADKAGYDKSKNNIDPIAGEIINIALSLVGVIFLALMIYAGFIWMNAKGDEAQATKAKNIIAAAIIGIAVILLAYVISMYVLTELGNSVLKDSTS